MVIIYKGKSPKAQKSQLSIQSTLFKDGQIYRREEPREIIPGETDEFGRIPIFKTLILDGKMDDGDYLLQLTISDNATSKPHTAVQAIDFQIRKE
jgi:hypothetical protein